MIPKGGCSADQISVGAIGKRLNPVEVLIELAGQYMTRCAIEVLRQPVMRIVDLPELQLWGLVLCLKWFSEKHDDAVVSRRPADGRFVDTVS